MFEFIVAYVLVGLLLSSWIWIGWIPRGWVFAGLVTFSLATDRVARLRLPPFWIGLVGGMLWFAACGAAGWFLAELV